MMLLHIGQPDIAEVIHNAWLTTLEEGLHTADIFTATHSKQLVGTQEFAFAIADRLGQQPKFLTPVSYQNTMPSALPAISPPTAVSTSARRQRTLAGVDIFLYHPEKDIAQLSERLNNIAGDALSLTMITNRGIKVWPEGLPETFCTDHWRCRFKANNGEINPQAIALLLTRLNACHLECIKTENLYHFDGQPAYSLGQGE